MHYLLSLRTLLAAILAGGGIFTATVILSDEFPAAMYLTPITATVEQGATQQFNVMVKSQVPVNAFAGEVVFDNKKFNVVDISYNTDMADLWVDEPWYNRAQNNIYFAGGTTDPDGFTGEESLITVTLQAVQTGDAAFSLHNPRILAHDGLGRDVSLVTPLDSLFTIDTTPYAVAIPNPSDNHVVVVVDLPPLDVNQDGRLGFQDVGVLLLSIGSNEPKHDFTGDGQVTWADIRQWQNLRTQE
jgi:hypothetical protein